MKELEKGKDKIQKICKILKEETLEPAHAEAKEIRTKALEEAQKIVKDAEARAEEILEHARHKIAQERSVMESALKQAGRQALESLRQDVETKLFNQELHRLVSEGSRDPQLIAKLLESVIAAVDKEGSRADLSAFIPASVPAKAVNAALGEAVVKRLREGGVAVGGFSGGAQVRLNADQMTIDITDAALQELLSTYVRKDFRKLLFG